MTPTRLVSRSENEAAWLERRRLGVTASDCNSILTVSGRRRLVDEKRSGIAASLAGIPAVEWGKAREKAVMEWVGARFGIPPNDHLWHGDDPRHLATPDGLLIEDGVVVEGGEVKCSGHEMSPGEYMAQIQWSMHVFGLDRWLLVWEWRDANFRPIGEPTWMWIDRDQGIIDLLVAEADALLAELDSEPLDDVILDESDEIAYYAGQVLDGRAIETRGKEIKEEAWRKLLVVLRDQPDRQWKSKTAQVTWSTLPACPTSTVDFEAMEAEAPEIVEAYRALQTKHTTIATGEPSRKLTITRRKS